MKIANTVERSRLAFDLGTNSIGWAVYRLDDQGRPCELVDCGVRLFSDGRNPKDGQSLAAMRRIPRAARRRRDRFIQRRDWLMTLLIRHGLMPENEAARKELEKLDPYDIRGRALKERLEPHEIGRALFHLNQRRGFKSNRVADAKGGDEKEQGKIASGAEKLKQKLKDGGFETLGEYYASMPAGPTRQTRTRINGKGTSAAYDFYPQRDMVEHEFNRIWEKQSAYHPELMTETARLAIKGEGVLSIDAWDRMTDEQRKTAQGAIFYQRPLKRPVIGRCTFFPEEFRLAVAHPVAQAFRIYQELANIEIAEGLERPRKLTLAERDVLVVPLLAGQDLTWGKVRKALDIGGAVKINLEEGGRDRLKGDESARRLGDPKTGRLRRLWPDLSNEVRAEIIDRLLFETETEGLTDWLVDAIGATPEEAAAAAGFRPPEGHIRLGLTAASGVVDALKRGDPETGLVIRYHQALARAFPNLHHSDLRTGEVFERLPDYRTVLERHTIGGTGNPEDSDDKRLGRVPNPTVHIGLNQLRRVINALIDLYGPPEQIVLELARDLKRSKEDKDKAQRDNKKNEEANRRRARDLEEAGYPDSPENIRRLRLWEDLGPLPRLCTYTGKPISFAQVFSDEIEVEHILPFSRTLDDSMANRTLAYREANRGKRNQAPEQAFHGADYEAIQQRADALPRNKAWRFKSGAMERFEAEHRGFLDRQLNETRHLSKLAKEYVVGITGDQNAVWVVTGQLTSLLRARWGLNFSNVKDRNNHRHHAIDAATIGVIDRGLLNEMAHRAGVKEEGDQLAAITKDVPEPLGFTAAGRNFRDNVRERVQALIVSHKAEHGKGGALHEDTAYGLVDPARGEDGNLVYRKAIDSLTAPEIGRVRDLKLRGKLGELLESLGGKKADAKKLSEALAAFGKENDIRRVRLLKTEAGVVAIKDRKTGTPYKALVPGSNYCMDIVEGADGVWRGHAMTIFEANQKDFAPAWRSDAGARFVMRLHKGDLVELEDNGERKIKRVVRLNPSENRMYLASHDEGGDLPTRHSNPDDPFRWDLATISKLKVRGCVQARLNEVGRLNPQA